MSRRIVVAFQAVETPQDRMWRELGGGNVTMEERRKPPGKGVYWCAADKPEQGQSGDLVLAPVYRTHEVPEDARCEECGIEIAVLQNDVGSYAR